jgi:chitodextrinase
MKLSEAKALRNAMDGASNVLTDEQALKVVALYPLWSASASYKVGERVRYNDTLYKCLQAHTAQDDWNPSDAVSLWAEVLIPDPEVIPDWKQPESTNPYMKGDKVKHNDKNWISDIDNNVWEPGVYGWSEYVAEEAPAYDEADAVATLASAITAKTQKSKVLENANVVALLNKYGISIETE